MAALSASSYSYVSMVQRFGPLMNEGGAAISLTYIASERIIPGLCSWFDLLCVVSCVLLAKHLVHDYHSFHKHEQAVCLQFGQCRSLSTASLLDITQLLHAIHTLTAGQMAHSAFHTVTTRSRCS